MAKKIALRVSVALMSALFALPGSGCLPADQAGARAAGVLQGEINTSRIIWNAGWPT